MRARLAERGIVLTAETRTDRDTLTRKFKQEHMHFSCKALGENKKGVLELLLTPSVIPWQRPAKGFGSQ